jgi:hypothetical protein
MEATIRHEQSQEYDGTCAHNPILSMSIRTRKLSKSTLLSKYMEKSIRKILL